MGAAQTLESQEYSKEPTQKELEDEAFCLLVGIVTRGRNNMPYKHLLPKLKQALDRAPQICLVIHQSMRENNLEVP